MAAPGAEDYEAFVASGDPDFAWLMPEDEMGRDFPSTTRPAQRAIPKGVVSHHRGAYLLAQGNALTTSMAKHSVYLWTLPNVSLQWLVFPLDIVGHHRHPCLFASGPRGANLARFGRRRRVTHLCGAPHRDVVDRKRARG